MNEVVMLRGHDSEEVLQNAIDTGVPAIMSYLSRGKWHVAKVLLTKRLGERLYVVSARSDTKRYPINIQVNQPVGMSFKHAHGKFVFDTTVVDLDPLPDSATGGAIVLAVPDRIGVLQRRSYFRVSVPASLKVNTVLWHRSSKRGANDQIHDYCHGRLVDISAGGAQVVVPHKGLTGKGACDSARPEFKKGQFVGVRFTPMPYETPLKFNAQIRNILPTADGEGACLGLQIVGLEASPEGREVLARLAAVVEQYYRMNQSGSEQRGAAHGAPEVPAEPPQQVGL
ncbi:MAG: PilZ domain-containing protein [Phycisphaerales bacterium]|nr:MAG: PilZ domain-containing protein [Phycisphaerales bacterium]